MSDKTPAGCVQILGDFISIVLVFFAIVMVLAAATSWTWIPLVLAAVLLGLAYACRKATRPDW